MKQEYVKAITEVLSKCEDTELLDLVFQLLLMEVTG